MLKSFSGDKFCRRNVVPEKAGLWKKGPKCLTVSLDPHKAHSCAEPRVFTYCAGVLAAMTRVHFGYDW